MLEKIKIKKESPLDLKIEEIVLPSFERIELKLEPLPDLRMEEIVLPPIEEIHLEPIHVELPELETPIKS